MSSDVFVYGTLMFPKVWHRVVRGEYASVPGRVRGWNRRRVAGAEYPGVTDGDEIVEGLVWRDVEADDVARLDHFESTSYDRRPVAVELEDGSSLEAQMYIFLRPDLLREPWSREEFERIGLRSFLAGYSGFSSSDSTA